MFDKLISANRLEKAMSGDKDGLADILREWINAQPEVRAIPIEWINNKAEDTSRAPLFRRYIQELLNEWDKGKRMKK